MCDNITSNRFCNDLPNFESGGQHCQGLDKENIDDDIFKLDTETNHQSLIKWASEKFINCHLKMNDDFNIYKHISDNCFGYFRCKLCFGYASGSMTRKFKFNKCGTIEFSKIADHLKMHFSISNHQCTKNKFDISHFDLHDSKSGTNHSDELITESSIEVSTEKHVEFVVKLASQRFQCCQLKVNDDFCLYRNKTFRSVGYFVCKLCREDSEIKSYCKVKFTKNDSIIFGNIENHLMNHFTQISETRKQKKTMKRKVGQKENSLEQVSFDEIQPLISNMSSEETVKKRKVSPRICKVMSEERKNGEMTKCETNFDRSDCELASDKHVDFVVKLASDRFESCKLKVNEEFSLYRSKKFKTVGYFDCKLCCDNSEMNNCCCKVTFTKNDSIIFTEIEKHLMNHFKKLTKPKKEISRKRKADMKLEHENLQEQVSLKLILNNEEILTENERAMKLQYEKLRNYPKQEITFEELINLLKE